MNLTRRIIRYQPDVVVVGRSTMRGLGESPPDMEARAHAGGVVLGLAMGTLVGVGTGVFLTLLFVPTRR